MRKNLFPLAVLLVMPLVFGLAGCGSSDGPISDEAELTPDEAGVTIEGFSWKLLKEDAALPATGVVSVALTPEGLWTVGDGKLYQSDGSGENFLQVSGENLPVTVSRVTFSDGILWALGNGAAYSADMGATWRKARLPESREWLISGAASLGNEAWLASDEGLLHSSSFSPSGRTSFGQSEPLMGAENGYRPTSDVAFVDGTIWATSNDERGYMAMHDEDEDDWILIASYDPFNRITAVAGHIWVATEGMGLWHTTDASDSFIEVLNGGDWDLVNGVAAGAGSVWAAVDGGAIYYAYADDVWEHHGSQEGLDFGVMLDCAYDEAANTVYFATPSGLAVGVKEGAAPPPPGETERADESETADEE